MIECIGSNQSAG